MSVQVVWRFAHESRCLWEHLDDAHIVYHSASGKTHFLNEISFSLLQNLKVKPATTLELARLVTDRTGEETTDELVQRFENHLVRLDQLGLIGITHD